MRTRRAILFLALTTLLPLSTAWTADRAEREEIMGLQHENEPIFGVQFHPESIGTDDGKRVIENFLKLVGT